jgi:hypothetical protein
MARLVIAGILAATMSTVSSGLSSLTTVLVTDWIAPTACLPADDTRLLRWCRALTAAGGALVVGSALLFSVWGALDSAEGDTVILATTPVVVRHQLPFLRNLHSNLAAVAVILSLRMIVPRAARRVDPRDDRRLQRRVRRAAAGPLPARAVHLAGDRDGGDGSRGRRGHSDARNPVINFVRALHHE